VRSFAGVEKIRLAMLGLPSDTGMLRSTGWGFVLLLLVFTSGATVALAAALYSAAIAVVMLAVVMACCWSVAARNARSSVLPAAPQPVNGAVLHSRSANIHPVTGLATRETLIEAIADGRNRSGTLGVIRFADYDG